MVFVSLKEGFEATKSAASKGWQKATSQHHAQEKAITRAKISALKKAGKSGAPVSNLKLNPNISKAPQTAIGRQKERSNMEKMLGI